MVEPSGRECQRRECLASSNPRERALPPLLLTLGWLVDRVPFTAPPATSWEDRGRPEGKAGGAPAHPTPHLCACVFCPFWRRLYPDPSSTVCTQNSLEGGPKLSSQNWGGVGHRFHPR